MAKTVVQTSGNSGPSIYGVLLCLIAILLSSLVLLNSDNPALTAYTSKSVASTKPYATFDEFYPFYLTEHTLLTTRQWHYLGTTLFLLYLLTTPILVLPLAAGGLAAYATIPFSRHLSTGLPEVAAFLAIYFTSGRLLTRSFLRTLLPLLLGYTCSWIGHFGFEHNKPAAFVYPTYSFFADIHMMFDAVKDRFAASI